MAEDRGDRILRAFHEVVELRPPLRNRRLVEIFTGDPEAERNLAEVESLLRSHDEAGDLLDPDTTDAEPTVLRLLDPFELFDGRQRDQGLGAENAFPEATEKIGAAAVDQGRSVAENGEGLVDRGRAHVCEFGKHLRPPSSARPAGVPAALN